MAKISRGIVTFVILASLVFSIIMSFISASIANTVGITNSSETSLLNQTNKTPGSSGSHISSLYNDSLRQGIRLAQKGDFQAAIKYYDKALAMEPNNIVLLINKGNALSHTGNYSAAISYYNKALAVGIPNSTISSSVWINKGDDLSHLRNYDEAVKSYDKALAIQPSSAIAIKDKSLALNALNNSTSSTK